MGATTGADLTCPRAVTAMIIGPQSPTERIVRGLSTLAIRRTIWRLWPRRRGSAAPARHDVSSSRRSRWCCCSRVSRPGRVLGGALGGIADAGRAACRRPLRQGMQELHRQLLAGPTAAAASPASCSIGLAATLGIRRDCRHHHHRRGGPECSQIGTCKTIGPAQRLVRLELYRGPSGPLQPGESTAFLSIALSSKSMRWRLAVGSGHQDGRTATACVCRCAPANRRLAACRAPSRRCARDTSPRAAADVSTSRRSCAMKRQVSFRRCRRSDQ